MKFDTKQALVCKKTHESILVFAIHMLTYISDTQHILRHFVKYNIN